MILSELFTDMADFRRRAPYVESNVTFEELNASALSARKRVLATLGREVWNETLSAPEGAETKEALRVAVANLTLAKQTVFDVIRRRKDDVDIYKHEQEAMRRAYADNYFCAMDTLTRLLDEEGSEAWLNTRYRKALDGLRVRSAADFDELYPIDESYLFFYRTVPLQREALDEGMEGYFVRAEGREDLGRTLLRCLAKRVVAIALKRFDIIEFPPTIRSLFDDSTASRSAADEQRRMLQLADLLESEVKAALADADLALAAADETAVDTETSFNRPDDKIYLMA